MVPNSRIAAEKTTFKVCPYCKGQSPTCIECDFGGFNEGPSYQRMHASAFLKPVEVPRVNRVASLETKLLQDKIQKDYKRLMEIYRNHISLVNDSGLNAARKFWTLQLYRENSCALQVNILEFLEVFRSVLHKQKVKNSVSRVDFAKGKKTKKNNYALVAGIIESIFDFRPWFLYFDKG